MTRTRKFGSNADGDHERPQRSEVVPSVKVVRDVLSPEVTLPGDHVFPPSFETRTQNFGELLDEFARPRSWTWIPRTVVPRLPIEKLVATSESRTVSVSAQLWLEAVPLPESVATLPSNPVHQFAGALW